MVVRVSLSDDVVSQVTLSQEGVGCDGFAFDVEAVEEGDGDFDFVGLFFFVTSFYWQGADFFWV